LQRHLSTATQSKKKKKLVGIFIEKRSKKFFEEGLEEGRKREREG
jgi:hypothetical protein